jgi:tRNA1Val (adenine37-N6)-methyltransferase
MSFTFKQFHLEDDQCAMKVGTDSILLGAWADLSAPTGAQAPQRLLDIGCGCGLLSLMLAQRLNGEGTIVAVEIEQQAAQQARQNVAESPWTDMIDIYHGDINQYDSGVDSENALFNVIISNPPYFSDSLQGPVARRNNARHTNHLSQQQLLNNAARLLTGDGVFYLILPLPEAKLLVAQSTEAGLFLQQSCWMKTKSTKSAHRRLLAFAKSDIVKVQQQEIEVYDENNQYSKQFIALTRNFYLNR